MGEEIKTIPTLKFEPKVLETWNFARSIPFISSFQKYLNDRLCQQVFFADTSIFCFKFSKILSKLDQSQIAISPQQIKVKTTLTPHYKVVT